MEYKEFKKLWKNKEIYKKEEKIKKEGIHFTMDDFADFCEGIEKDMKKMLKERLNKFIKDFNIL